MGMKGKIALCSLGCLGLITNDKKQSVSYTALVDGALSGEVYVGIHLQDTAHAKAGDPWSSRNPYVLGDAAALTAKPSSSTCLRNLYCRCGGVVLVRDRVREKADTGGFAHWRPFNVEDGHMRERFEEALGD